MSKQNFDAALAQKLSELEKSKMPERDLWQGIELALANEPAPNQIPHETPKKTVSTRIFAVAATFAFIGLFSWFSMNQPEQGVIGGQELVAALSDQHREQKDALLVRFRDQPALTQNWEQQLDELDDAAAAIKSALKEEPNNIALLKMLQNVHQQQIDLIERVHAPKWQQI